MSLIYLVHREHQYTVSGYLQSDAGQELRIEIRLRDYRDLPHLGPLPASTFVFSDHERLTPAETAVAVRVWEQLSGHPSTRLLNDPRRVLRRYQLLDNLFQAGRNAFRVYRADPLPSSMRFPVFVREEQEHNGSCTPLLHTSGEVEQALRRLTGAHRGLIRQNLLVVEFCDTRDSSRPWFRKYSAFRVGGRIIPRYVHISRDWVVKSGNSVVSAETVAEESAFMATNPHQEWLFEIFELAGIDYGRIDYSMLGDRPQVWEINTNPMMGQRPRTARGAPEPEADVRRRQIQGTTRHLFHSRFRAALEEIEVPARPGELVPIEYASHLIRELQRESRRRMVNRLMRVIRRRMAGRRSVV